MLANMSQSNAVLAAAGGQDPLAGAMQAGQDGSKHPGEQVVHYALHNNCSCRLVFRVVLAVATAMRLDCLSEEQPTCHEGEHNPILCVSWMLWMVGILKIEGYGWYGS